MIVDSTAKFRIDKQRYKKEYMSPKNETLLSSPDFQRQYNYQDIKRPLKTNHSDLSFKGLSLGMYKKSVHIV